MLLANKWKDFWSKIINCHSFFSKKKSTYPPPLATTFISLSFSISLSLFLFLYFSFSFSLFLSLFLWWCFSFRVHWHRSSQIIRRWNMLYIKDSDKWIFPNKIFCIIPTYLPTYLPTSLPTYLPISFRSYLHKYIFCIIPTCLYLGSFEDMTEQTEHSVICSVFGSVHIFKCEYRL